MLQLLMREIPQGVRVAVIVTISGNAFVLAVVATEPDRLLYVPEFIKKHGHDQVMMTAWRSWFLAWSS